jgi:regulator of replication initiation timing
MAVLRKDTKINRQKEKLTELYSNLDDNKKSVAESLIDNAAFMIVNLSELRDEINKSGMIYKYENGKQSNICEHPANKVYINMIPKYLAIMKQLCDLLPNNVEQPKKDDFLSFIEDT